MTALAQTVADGPVTFQTVPTPFGTGLIASFTVSGQTHYLVPRHGHDRHLLPHAINYRANILALKTLGVDAVVATAAVGSLRPDLTPRTFVIPDQFIDWTRQRPLTLFDGADAPIAHADLSQPFCPTLRSLLLSSQTDLNLSLTAFGCYACTEGPRYETKAEVRALASLGADIVGMTVATEAVLCREAEICYAAIAVVTNVAAGISAVPLTHSQVEETMVASRCQMFQLISWLLRRPFPSDCSCRRVWDSSPDARRWLRKLMRQ